MKNVPKTKINVNFFILIDLKIINRVGSERLVRSLSSHTTVRTVRYTAVPCFDTLLRVGCCFQLSIKLNHSCLFLRFRPTFLARSLLKSIWLIILKVTFIYYHTARFCPSTLRKTSCFFFRLVTVSTMTSADFSQQLLSALFSTSVRSPEVRRVTFIPCIGIIYTY